MNVRQLLDDQAQRHADKPAVIFKETSRSFSQLRDEVLHLAAGLSRIGVGRGDKIGIYLPNCPEYAISYLAGFCLGAVVVPLDFMLTQDEILACLSHAEIKVLIAQPKKELDMEGIREVLSLEALILLGGASADLAGQGFWDFSQVCCPVDAVFKPVSIQENDPALIMYTSGTTGRPKGILLNYRHLDGSPQAMEHFVDLSERDVKLAAIPLSHIGGFIYIQNCLVFGITVVLMDRFHPLEFLKNVQQYRVTCFHIVPAMYQALLSLKILDHFDLSSLRWVVVFGAPSSPETLERFHRYCPNAKLLNGWGMTETCPPNTVTPMDSGNIASVGRPSPMCRIRIMDDDARELPAGQVGEIFISGWIVMAGYYKDPESTAAVKQNGWLSTGDLGRFDDDGFLYIVGRKKDMIKVAGQIVYAPEVEAAFERHEAVKEVAVIGVPDPLRGEAVKAYVVLKEGFSLTSLDLRSFAREHLAHFKVPQGIELCGELPKNRMGKIDKNFLKDNDRKRKGSDDDDHEYEKRCTSDRERPDGHGPTAPSGYR
jgi:long-chain acyl-CoA synthetase